MIIDIAESCSGKVVFLPVSCTGIELLRMLVEAGSEDVYSFGYNYEGVIFWSSRIKGVFIND